LTHKPPQFSLAGLICLVTGSGIVCGLARVVGTERMVATGVVAFMLAGIVAATVYVAGHMSTTAEMTDAIFRKLKVLIQFTLAIIVGGLVLSFVIGLLARTFRS